jgi:nucleoside-diphosphate-sugar epimerase
LSFIHVGNISQQEQLFGEIMRVFITGASGYVGHSVAKAFRAKGHTVYGLVRSQEDAHLLSLDEIWPIMGDLEQTDSYHQVLQEVEVAVHCASNYTSDKRVELDALTVDTILDIFSHSNLPRSFIYTSGIWVYGSQGYKMVDESMPIDPIEIAKWRPAHEEKVLKATSPSLRTVVMRPGVVYGGVGGLTNLLFTSTQNGSVSIVGEGKNRWPMVHVQDLAYAYVSAAERELSNVILNVVDDSTATLGEIAEAIARAAKLEGKITTLSEDEAAKQFGPFVQGVLLDLTANNSRIKRLLGWQIHHAPFIYDCDIYYNAWQTTQQSENF